MESISFVRKTWREEAGTSVTEGPQWRRPSEDRANVHVNLATIMRSRSNVFTSFVVLGGDAFEHNGFQYIRAT